GVQNVAARSEMPPKMLETVCQGGVCRPEGLEISRTPLESVSIVACVSADLTPRVLTSVLIAEGPPFFTICALDMSVTTLECCRPRSTAATSPWVSFRAKKCWLIRTLLSLMQP